MSHPTDQLKERTLAMLSRRGLLAPARTTASARVRSACRSEVPGNATPIPLTIYQQPAWRGIVPGREPQPLMEAGARQRDLVVLSHATQAAAADLCAAWVERVFARMGMGFVTGDASALYRDWCRLTATDELLVGMIVAVPVHPYGAGGRSWGHVGYYVGDGCVRHCSNGRVATAPLDVWLSVYGVMAEPRWGWLGGIALG